MKRKYRKFVLLFLLATAPASLAADRERVKEVGQHLMCICSCNQLLTGCNHINCPSSPGMLAEVSRRLDAGQSKDAIVADFVEKFGISVLSSPPASGFNLSAWAMPFVALAVGAFMVVFFARRFRSRWPATTPETAVDTGKYQQRVEDELKNYTPED